MTGIELLVMLRERHIEQNELARRIGVTHAAVSRYIRGTLNITPDRERQIRQAIDAIVTERQAGDVDKVAEAATA